MWKGATSYSLLLAAAAASSVAALCYVMLYKNGKQEQQRRKFSFNSPGSVQALLRCGKYEVQGERDHMEDAFTIEPSLHPIRSKKENCVFLGVFDGHGGKRAADYLSQNLSWMFAEHSEYANDPQTALCEAIAEIENNFLRISRINEWNDGAVIAVSAIMSNTLILSNVGDAEIVLSSSGVARVLTEMHNPSKNDKEIERVTQAGGRLWHNRVGHPSFNMNFFSLAVSRAIGDDMYKNPLLTRGKPSGITATPFSLELELDVNRDDFLILACDGLWDAFTYQDAVDFVRQHLVLSNDVEEVCKLFVLEAERRSGKDNITAIVATWKYFIKT